MAQQAAAGRHAGPFKKPFKQYEQPWHMSKFQPVKAHIAALDPELLSGLSTKDTDVPGYLSKVSAALEEGMDDIFGVRALEEDRRKMTKIPAKLFDDFEPGGGASVILIAALQYRKRGGLDFGVFESVFVKDRKMGRQHVVLFLEIEKALLNAGLLVRPKVFIGADLPKQEKNTLKDIVVAHHGQIASSRGHATHEIVPDSQAEEAEGEFCRSLETQDRMAKVHWWYYPDSYHEWTPTSKISGAAEPPMVTPKLWKVYARFVRDLDKFNEWMNEEDYLDEEGGDGGGEGVEGAEEEEEEGVAGGKRKRGDDEGVGEGGGEPVKKQNRPQGQYKALPASLGKVQSGANRAVTSLQTFANASKPFTSMEKGQAGTGGKKGVEGGPVIMPSYASWFRFEQIHAIEKRAMAEWFKVQDSVSKTSKTYVECRDLIINLYRDNPRKYLTATECRRHLAVDVCSVIRLHGFLEHWGLINYQINTADKPVMIGPSDTAGHPILLAMPDGSLVPKDEALVSGSHSATAPPPAAALPSVRLVGRANVFSSSAESAAGMGGGPGRVLCSITGEDCTAERYHCVSKPQVVICPAKFASGDFPPPYTAADFVQVVNAEADSMGVIEGISDWTETETLRLLEGLEQHNEDWTLVADHVKTKSREQCIQHFLRLPIEDRYLTEAPAPSQPAPSTQAATEHHTLGGTSVMAQLAFLCGSLAPEVAQKATNAAFQVLLKAEAPGKAVELAMRNHSKSSEPNASKEGGLDEDSDSLKSIKDKASSLTALAGAALRAKSLALTEEKEIQRLVSQVVQRQVQKLDRKLKAFEKLEAMQMDDRGGGHKGEGGGGGLTKAMDTD